MEKTELTVSMEPERLDALRYFLAAKNKRTPQKELQRALEELYEAYVPAETRAYLDARCRPDRDRRRRPAASKAIQMQKTVCSVCSASFSGMEFRISPQRAMYFRRAMKAKKG